MVLHKWDNSSNIQPKFYRKSEFRKSGYRERNLRINAIWIFYVPCKIVVMCEFYGRLMYSSMGLFPERFFPPTRINDPDMHHATCVTHVQWCIPGSLISGFLWSRWRGKRSRHARRMRNPHFYVSGKRPMDVCFLGPEQHITNLWKKLSALLTIWVGNPLVTCDFPSRRVSNIIVSFIVNPNGWIESRVVVVFWRHGTHVMTMEVYYCSS